MPLTTDQLLPVFALLLLLGWAAAAFFFARARQADKRTARTARERDAARAELSVAAVRLEGMDGLEGELARERDRISDLERRESALTTRLEERERHVAELKERMENDFRSMSQKLLRETSDALMREAAQTFEKQKIEARADAEGYSKSVGELLKPMRDTLSRYEVGLREMRDQQKRAQGELTGQIATLARSANQVQAEARTLAAALKAGPRARGRWGEITLRNVVEMTGMAIHCDFVEQVSVAGEDGGARKIPDMVVNLPGERLVAVDSKVSLSDWLDVAGAHDDGARQRSLDAHGRSVWTHVQQLGQKDYAQALRKDGAIDFVVMFIPGETFFTAAVEARPSLLQDAYDRGVLIATPTTLIAILKAVAHGWRQQNASENARKVAGLAEDLYDSLRVTGDRLLGLGKSLGKSVEEYNKLVGSMETRVLPRARKFAHFDMPGTQKQIAPIDDLDSAVRYPATDRDLLFSDVAGAAE